MMSVRNVTSGGEATSDDVVLASILLSVLIVGTIFGNTLVCLAFYLFRDLRSVTNYFVVSLAVADLLVGFVSMPLWFTTLTFQWPSPKSTSGLYILWLCLDIATSTASIVNLTAISIDRFYAITSPFKYPVNVTKKRVLVCIFLVWLYALAVSVIRATPLFGKWYTFFIASASFFIPLPVMIFCYVCIFRVARIQAVKIRKLDTINAQIIELNKKLDKETNGDLETLCTTTKKGRPILKTQISFYRQRRALSSEIKAAKTLAIVMGAFIFCWGPYIITLLVDRSCPLCIPRSRLGTLARIVKWLHYSNSSLNPIIYTLLNRTFRNAFRRVLCRSCRRNDGSPSRTHQITIRSLQHCGLKSCHRPGAVSEIGEALECNEWLTVV
ncbi:octopamine receptor-like [Actinia tenebrosa]|uniref:Octopamine receptor-like n=1 Tax=Actinia tenebrosa TaxID=6105 RepID=A0A6P8GYV4_ACTTE|nr:octopamine receptor-like [Actinia tenebrosa]